MAAQSYSAQSNPYGKTYGSWTVEWWQWALSTPARENPVLDKTGMHWNTNQPTSDVWFFAGRWGTMEKSYPRRKITVGSGRGILFPILNCEANPLEYPDLISEDDLINHVVNDVDTVVKKECFLNGVRLEPVRIQSDPKIFPIRIDKENALGITSSGSTRAAADGYWVFLKPLPVGDYILDFEGSCEFGRLSAGAKYILKIA